jgi:hypothetical protein
MKREIAAKGRKLEPDDADGPWRRNIIEVIGIVRRSQQRPVSKLLKIIIWTHKKLRFFIIASHPQQWHKTFY